MSQVQASTVGPSPFVPAWVNRWLVWKEARLLFPLVAAVVTISVLIGFLQQVFGQPRELGWNDDAVMEMTLLLIPGLFTTGVGLVLVGQEREHRTLDWMMTLPPSPRQIVLTKMALGFVTLAGLWLLTIVLIESLTNNYITRWRFSELSGSNDGITPVSYPMWMVHSVYLAAASFYASWRLEKPLFALTVFVALAAVPLVLSSLFSWTNLTFYGAHTRGDAEQWGWMICSLGATAVVLPLSYLRAVKVMSPQRAPRHVPTVSVAIETTETIDSKPPLFATSYASLVWQFVHASRWSIVGIIALICFGIERSMHFAKASFAEAPQSIVGAFPIIVAASLLGILVFKSDANITRIRFLADRGVSPTKLFWARQLVPLSILSTTILFYTYWATNTVVYQINLAAYTLPSLATQICSLGIVYSFSLLASMQFRTITLSLLCAPVISIWAFGWLIQATLFFDVSPMWLGFWAAIPLLLAWWLMPRYMDARDRPIGPIVSCVLLGAMCGFWVWAAAPSASSVTLPTALRSQMNGDGDLALHRATKAVRIETRRFQPGSPDRFDQKPTNIAQSIELISRRSATPSQFIVGLDQLLGAEITATIEFRYWQDILLRLMHERLLFENAIAGNKPNAPPEDSVEAFSDWLNATSRLAASLRKSPVLADQETADQVEIWLIDTVSRKEIREHVSRKQLVATASRMSTIDSRNKARRAATLASRRKFLNRGTTPAVVATIGGIFPAKMNGGSADTIAAAALVAVDLRQAEPLREVLGQPWREAMHEVMLGPTMPFEFGPYSERRRKIPAIMSLQTGFSYQVGKLYPGQYWGMEWENQIQAFRKEMLEVTP